MADSQNTVTTGREALVKKLSATMDPDNAKRMVDGVIQRECVDVLWAATKERNAAMTSSDAKRIVFVASLRKLIADWRADIGGSHAPTDYADELEELIDLLTRT